MKTQSYVKVFHEIKVNKHRRLKIRQSWTSPQAPWFCHLQLLPVSPLCLWRRRFRLSLLPYYCQVTFCHFFFFLFLSIYLVISISSVIMHHFSLQHCTIIITKTNQLVKWIVLKTYSTNKTILQPRQWPWTMKLAS